MMVLKSFSLVWKRY